jgi:hypothetical protein
VLQAIKPQLKHKFQLELNYLEEILNSVICFSKGCCVSCIFRLSFNIVAIQKQIIKEISRKSLSVIGYTYCIRKTILCSGNKAVGSISSEFLNILDGQIKISVDPIL